MIDVLFKVVNANICRNCYVILALFMLAVIFTSNVVFSQNTDVSQPVIEDLIEDIAQSIEAKVDYSQVTDNLYYFIDNPINLNSTTTQTLEKLTILNVFQIKSLLNYIDLHNDMATLYELQLVDGFDYNTINRLLPFVTISDNSAKVKWQLSRALQYGNNTILARVSSTIEVPKGYLYTPYTAGDSNSTKYYLGDRSRIYSRYKFNYKNKLQWGITAEKDPGEQFLKGNQPYGFDFYSAHLQIDDVGIIKTAIIGDYQVQFGQGLIMWSYITMGKSSLIMNVKKCANGINRYTSTGENTFLRGGAITMHKGQFSLTTFGSYKSIDANISVADTLNSEPYFSSFLNSGIHTTASEIGNMNSVNELLLGGNFTWRYNNVKIGFSGVNYQYNYPYKPADTPYNIYKFSGKNNSNVSIDAEFKFNNIHLFSESAISQNGGKAVVVGALMELTSQVRTSVLYRNYTKEYQALYSNAFTEGSTVQNEEGFYMGIEMYPVKRWRISGYYDVYKFPWLKLMAQAPSKGSDFLAQADFTTSRTLSMYWRYKFESKDGNVVGDTIGFSKLAKVNKSLIRYNIRYGVTENWELRNRIELSYYSKDEVDETGYMLYQDVIFKPKKHPISIIVRYAIFDTETYNTRIYTYENDVLNAYSVPPLYGVGTRVYLLINYTLFEQTSLWLRISQAKYSNDYVIGSGQNQIVGNTKTDVRFQLRYKF